MIRSSPSTKSKLQSTIDVRMVLQSEPGKYPRGAYFILGGYLLERLVYYGMFGGAVFYMQRVLGFSAAQSSSIKSILEGLIYLAPILGAIIADSIFGKVSAVEFTLHVSYLYVDR